MPFCPACKTEQSRRVAGRCPNCKTQVEVYDGYWYPAGTGSPNLKILQHFEDLMSDRLTAEQGRSVVFRVPKKAVRYPRELVQAGKLLEMADYDIQDTLDAITLLFKDRKFSWKNFTTLLWMTNEFPVSLAIVRARKAAQVVVENREDKYVNELLNTDDIFS